MYPNGEAPSIEEELDRKLNAYLVHLAKEVDCKNISPVEAKRVIDAIWDITTGLVNDELSTLVSEMEKLVMEIRDYLPSTAVFAHESGVNAVIKRGAGSVKMILFKGSKVIKSESFTSSDTYQESMKLAAKLKQKGFFCLNV